MNDERAEAAARAFVARTTYGEESPEYMAALDEMARLAGEAPPHWTLRQLERAVCRRCHKLHPGKPCPRNRLW